MLEHDVRTKISTNRRQAAMARATGHPRNSRALQSIANFLLYHFMWARHRTTLRDYDIKYQSGPNSSHRADQKLWRQSVHNKFPPLSCGLASNFRSNDMHFQLFVHIVLWNDTYFQLFLHDVQFQLVLHVCFTAVLTCRSIE